MLTDDLYSLFRSDIVDEEAPYLWTDVEVWNYMNDAYRMYFRLTGGIPDSLSSETQVNITAGSATSPVSPLILKFNSAYLVSDGTELTIINGVGIPKYLMSDYGYGAKRGVVDMTTQGPVRYMVTNVARDQYGGTVRWLRVPAVSDGAQLDVYRLPVDTITGTGFAFDELPLEHHEALLMWMKARAYGKQDAETYNRGKRDEFDKAFRSYCADAKGEARRYKSHSMAVGYGGL